MNKLERIQFYYFILVQLIFVIIIFKMFYPIYYLTGYDFLKKKIFFFLTIENDFKFTNRMLL